MRNAVCFPALGFRVCGLRLRAEGFKDLVQRGLQRSASWVCTGAISSSTSVGFSGCIVFRSLQ